MNDKTAGHRLIREWEQIITADDLSPEVGYRLRKLILRMTPLLDKMFIKTVKASDMISECLQKTGALGNLPNRKNDRSVFLTLTELEKTFEMLLKETYEFRIKAG